MLRKTAFIGLLLGLALPGIENSAIAQNQLGQEENRLRTITTAVPFLTIAPDARAAGMGDVGAATSPDANSIHWNAAKLAFIESDFGASISYSPWLRNLVPDMSLVYLTGYYKLDDVQAIGVSMRYFDLGEIQLTNEVGENISQAFPREYALDGSYSRKLSDNLSIAASARFIHSNISGGVSASTTNNDAKPGNTAAVDIGMFNTNELVIGGAPIMLNFGAVISNLGGKISYTNAESQDFIPTNLRLGTTILGNLDDYNTLSFSLDFNKLMVPSPPVRDINRNIVQGRDPDRSVFSGVFGSFNDAPDGMSEEAKEVMVSVGVEYWYNDLFAVRGGYFYENEVKGNRKYFTAGIGLRYQVFGVDFAYLIPQEQYNPLAETLRFSLLFNFNRPDAPTVEDVNPAGL